MRVIYQNEVAECGYACLAMVLSHLGRATEVRELSTYKPISANGLTLMDLYDVATEFGLSVQAFRYSVSDLASIKRGSILHFGGAHFVVFEKCTRGYVQVIDPAVGRRRVAMEIFLAATSGYLLECTPTPQMPRISHRSRLPAALKAVRTLNPQMGGQLAKILFVAIGTQFAILAMPYLGNLTLDYVVSADNLNLLNVLLMTFGSIFIIGAFSQYAQSYLIELIYTLTHVNSTQGVVGHLLRNPMSYFEKRHVGDVFARVKAQQDISSFATRTKATLYIDLSVGLLCLLLMLVQSRMLTAVTLGVFCLYVLCSYVLYVPMRDMRALVLEEGARCDDTLIETIRAASLIKLSQGEIRRTAIFMGRFKSFSAATLNSARLTSLRDAILKAISYIDTILLAWLSARLMLGGQISVGVFYSFMIYKALLSERLARSINAGFEYFMLDVPVARVNDITDCEEERYTPLESSQKSVEIRQFERIEVRDASFSYGISDHPVLKNASIDIRKGDKIVITGPSGSGKSTLFKLLAASEPLQEGSITLNGIAWSNLSVDEIRRHETHMRQGDIILNGSIADNITLFSGNPDEERIREILEAVGLWQDIMRLPMRTRTLISDSIANISAGQRQRLLLARTLYQQREIMLLDEPTSNLDPVSVKRIGALLQSLDRTVVVITHDMSLASVFDIHYRLIDGTLVPDEKVHSPMLAQVA